MMTMPSNLQMELIDLKTNLSLKMKFEELSSAPNASDMIQFRLPLPCENLPEVRTFARDSYVVYMSLYMSFIICRLYVVYMSFICHLYVVCQRFICRFGTTYKCEQAFSAMRLIKTKTWS